MDSASSQRSSGAISAVGSDALHIHDTTAIKEDYDVETTTVTPMIKVDLYLLRRWRYDDRKYCSHCSTEMGATRYKCLRCTDFWLCHVCFTSAEFIHPGHQYQIINLHARFPLLLTTPDSAADAYGLKLLDKGRREFVMLPRNCCPTCLNHRPGEIRHRQAINKDFSCWMRMYSGGAEWESTHEIHGSDLERSAQKVAICVRLSCAA